MLEESKLLVAEGIEAARAHRQLQAEALLTDALTLDPDNEEAWMWLARVAVRPDDKRTALQNALRLNPGNAETRLALREIENPEAAAELKRRLERARAAGQGGDEQTAMAAWRAVWEVDPGNAEAVSAVVELLGPERAQQARALIQRALKHDPHNAVLMLRFAEQLAAASRWDQVTRVLDRVNRRGLPAAADLERMGRLYMSAGKMRQAREAFEEAVARPGYDPALYYQIGRLLEREGETDRAVEAYRHVVDEAWGAREAGQAERRLRELSPYLPPSVADSWPFILREAAGWVVFIFLLVVLDSGVRIVGMSATGLIAIVLSPVGGVCWAVGGVETETLNLFGERALSDTLKQVLRVAAVVLFVLVVTLSLSNSLRSTFEFATARFS